MPLLDRNGLGQSREDREDPSSPDGLIDAGTLAHPPQELGDAELLSHVLRWKQGRCDLRRKYSCEMLGLASGDPFGECQRGRAGQCGCLFLGHMGPQGNEPDEILVFHTLPNSSHLGCQASCVPPTGLLPPTACDGRVQEACSSVGRTASSSALRAPLSIPTSATR